MPPKREEGDDLLGNLRPNAPASVVKAAKASLKEPSRPFTPADASSRQLFGNNDFDNHRPPSSYGVPTSKHFYESSPRLPWARPEPLGSASSKDSAGRIMLDSSGSFRGTLDSPRGMAAGASSPLESLSSPADGPSRLMKASSGRPTAAETVAALKANMTAMELSKRRLGTQTQQQQQQLGYEEEEEQGLGVVLDPYRDDDLPSRPTTSRGRPSSALVNEDPLMPESSPSTGPVPTPLRMGTNAQVLGIAPDASDNDNDDDESYRHLYSYAVPTAPTQDAPGSSDKTPTSGPPAPSSTTATKPMTRSAAPLDPCDPISPWRSAVEESLLALAASTSCFVSVTGPAQRDAMSDLLRHTTALGAHVEYMRRQPHSSRWLNAPCLHHVDASTGHALTIRDAVSEHVFRLMDSSNAELLLKGCGIILRVVKSWQPLLQSAKMLYRLSKDTANDSLFRRERLLEPVLKTITVMMGSSSASSSTSTSMHEPLVYLNGCLKNVSNDSVNQRSLVKAGALQVLAALLTQMAAQVDVDAPAALRAGANAGSAESFTHSSTSDMAAQVAVQVTGVLRNLAVSPAHTAAFTESRVLASLRSTAAALSRQQEVVLNVGRILSKLSLNEECQAIMESDPLFAPLLVSLLRQYSDNRAILLRMAFVLGNLTTNSNEYRLQVSRVPGSLDAIVSILMKYARHPDVKPPHSTNAAQEAAAQEQPGSAGEGLTEGRGGGAGLSAGGGVDRLSRTASPEDCIVKMLRLVANLAIHPEVGPVLSEYQAVVDCILHLLSSFRYDQAEELVLNCVCALTNLSFYHNNPSNQILAADPSLLLCHITPLLMCDNEEAMVEAARAYGNFSRTHESREYMQTAKVLDAMLLLLEHSNLELLYSICGTLINFTVDSERKEALVELGGVMKLMEVMERVVTSAEVSEIEVDILLVLFKALYNICVDDAAEGEQLTSNPAVTETEITTIEAIVEHIRSSDDFASHEEVLQLSDRLLTQVRLIAQKLEAMDLRPL